MSQTNDAVLQLFASLPLQGPGSDRDTISVLGRVRSRLPGAPALADFGCGTGRSSLALAHALPNASVQAIDAVPLFTARLRQEAERRGIADRLRADTGDMLASGIEPGTLDLVWSEGAAYAVGFARALRAWRPLLRPHGLCVVSECEWLSDRRPAAVEAFWREAYPGMGDRAENSRRAEAAGYAVLATHVLSEDGWTAYYGALSRALDAAGKGRLDPAFVAAIGREMEIRRRSEGSFGYVFSVLRPR